MSSRGPIFGREVLVLATFGQGWSALLLDYTNGRGQVYPHTDQDARANISPIVHIGAQVDSPDSTAIPVTCLRRSPQDFTDARNSEWRIALRRSRQTAAACDGKTLLPAEGDGTAFAR
jgi:hypothetical protein